MQHGIFAATILALGILAAPARAEVISLSCDDGGMLLVIDTDRSTVNDKNPFQKTNVTSPLIATDSAYTWHEGNPGAGAGYSLDKASRKVTATTDSPHGPTPLPLSNPQCGKSAVLLPRG